MRKPRKERQTDGKEVIIEAGEMVVFVAGESPIKGTQILYFLDPVFRRRAAIPAPATDSTVRAAEGRSGHDPADRSPLWLR